ncbi:MAG: hypothetical protein ACLTAK_01360 [Bacilli bacterium]
MKKIIFILLLTFFAINSVSAEDKSYTLDYTEDISSFFNHEAPYVNGTIETAINNAIDYYKNKGKNFIVSLDVYSKSFALYFFKDIDDVSFGNIYDELNNQYYSSFHTSGETIGYCNFSNFSGPFSSWNQELKECDEHQDSIYTSFDFFPNYKISNYNLKLPYYSTFKISEFDKKQDFNLIVHSNYGDFDILKTKNINYLMYRGVQDGSFLEFSSKTFITALNSDALSDNNIIASLTTRTTFEPFDNNKYKYFYYFKEESKEENENFKEIEFENDYFEYEIKKNGILYFKVSSLDGEKNYYNSTYVIDKIGKKYDSSIIDSPQDADDFLSNITWDNVMDIITSPIDFVKNAFSWVVNYFKDFCYSKLKILSQFREIINSFKYNNDKCSYFFSQGDTPYRFDYCIPEFKINFNFIGIDKELSVAEFKWFIPYRDNVLNFIKIIIAFITFYKLLDIVSGIRLRNTR